ncbi:uncharacterized protein CTRU02_206893 [Colletotrichum truncatum]|uniref:Uncharacterized protein n=1 Tax=Colletotrichum truncatum TaxID=5467 RepID=A0ACC3YZB1_COLTU|nr:uncharacterized protein CTRU02_15388 [Colletotrichum truncatum]KAF6781108.1 hypothetical protein CTRU02_15388 [Colletotrichum truncatum]
MARLLLLLTALGAAFTQVDAACQYQFNGPSGTSETLCLPEGSSRTVSLGGATVSYTFGSFCGSVTVNSGTGINVNILGSC